VKAIKGGFSVTVGMTLRIAFVVLGESCLLIISLLSHLAEVFFSNTKRESVVFRWLLEKKSGWIKGR
jgi:hypothetical protein